MIIISSSLREQPLVISQEACMTGFPCHIRQSKGAGLELIQEFSRHLYQVSSNSTSVRVRWELLNDARMNHMAETGIKGMTFISGMTITGNMSIRPGRREGE